MPAAGGSIEEGKVKRTPQERVAALKEEKK
jgi:hypothetical protein